MTAIDESHGSIRETEASASETESHGSLSFEDIDMEFNYGRRGRVWHKSISVVRREIPESTKGWPLLPRTNLSSLKFQSRTKERDTSVVEWVMTLPDRSSELSLQHQIDSGLNSRESNNSSFEVSSSFVSNESPKSTAGWPLLRDSPISDCSEDSEALKMPATSQIGSVENPIERRFCKKCLMTPRKLIKKMEMELLIKLKPSGCKRFSYKELKKVTSQFSSGNLIGEGGCSNVYKGNLPGNKPVAIKVLKSYKEAWEDFTLETEIMSSLKHKYITPLIGACIEDHRLILVYDYLPKGSLEEILHGGSEESVLPWKVRFEVAVSIAEALDYLHNQCSRPVIHRDVKSSNILLSNEYKPQLSDFGLAIWGPTDSSCMIQDDVVGTLGYIAPEYFMYGRVSDRIDVYSFGVVLLELLAGKRPIDLKLKGQENLVNWAKPLLASGDISSLLDPKLNGDFDILQMHRMVQATTLCVSQSVRSRPNIRQVLELLKGETGGEKLLNSNVDDSEESAEQEDDIVFPEIGYLQDLDRYISIMEADEDESISVNTDGRASLSCVVQKKHHKLKEYLKEQQD
ncbi:pto-interacting protein 1-like [Tripterygium wilfordii]|uniref:pto-interacting protein 1-like n=1 Tax=Tripterygium wilfordii TaxID=458696 RepID=UPI0018F84CDB|nr:pto-interacting protein 1-like [Tripterygium wilfordii]